MDENLSEFLGLHHVLSKFIISSGYNNLYSIVTENPFYEIRTLILKEKLLFIVKSSPKTIKIFLESSTSFKSHEKVLF